MLGGISILGQKGNSLRTVHNCDAFRNVPTTCDCNQLSRAQVLRCKPPLFVTKFRHEDPNIASATTCSNFDWFGANGVRTDQQLSVWSIRTSHLIWTLKKVWMRVFIRIVAGSTLHKRLPTKSRALSGIHSSCLARVFLLKHSLNRCQFNMLSFFFLVNKKSRQLK